MKAGDYNKRVTIERPVRATNAIGEVVTSQWAEVATVWANIHTLTQNETLRAKAVQSDTTHVVTIRYRDDVTDNLRLVYVGKDYVRHTLNITGVTDPDFKHDELRITVTETNG